MNFLSSRENGHSAHVKASSRITRAPPAPPSSSRKRSPSALVARSGDDAYGTLSVIVATYAEARILGRLRPGSFCPPPKVDA